MKSKLIASFFVALMLMVTTAYPQSVSDRGYDNTVAIFDDYGHGSGVLVTRGDETFIWTVAHVADHLMNKDGSFQDVRIRRGDKVGKARVIRCGDSYVADDIALLQVIEGDFKGTAHFYRAFNEVKLGQEIVHCGNPFDMRLNGNLLFYGHISHIGREFSLPFIPVPRELDQCDIIAYPGCSGGPILDARTGGILGVMSLGGDPGLAAMVPTRSIYEWAKKHDCLWAFDPEVPLPRNIYPWRADIIDRTIKDRNTTVVDARWGEAPDEPEPEPIEPEPVESVLGVLY
jgi:hypothetical protein